MTRRPPLDLMGAAEIGRLLGVSRQHVQQLVKSVRFPAPVAGLDMGKVWLAAEVVAWSERRALQHGAENGTQARPRVVRPT